MFTLEVANIFDADAVVFAVLCMYRCFEMVDKMPDWVLTKKSCFQVFVNNSGI